MKALARGMIILLGLAFAIPTLAADEASIAAQRSLDDRLLPILREYDPRGLVFSKLEAQTSAAELPGTPFVMHEVSVGGAPSWKSVEIVVVSQHEPFSPNVLALLSSAADRLGYPNAVVRVEPLPKELLESGINAEAQAREQKAIEQEKRAHEQWQLAIETLHQIGVSLLGLGGALVLIALAIAYVGRSGFGRLVGAAESALKAVAASIEKSVEGLGRLGGGSSAPTSARSAAPAYASAPGAGGGDGGLADYPEESLLACLTDCYWSEADGYAAFVWRRIPVAKKRLLLDKAPVLTEYATYLAQVAEEDLGAIEEPYYLSPLPVFHLNAAAVSAIVRQSPSLLIELSTLRLDKLTLTMRERIELRMALAKAGKKGSKRLRSLPDLAALAPSQPRMLKTRGKLPVRSLEEEREILSFSQLPLELMEEVPTLGWLRLLSLEEIEALFKPFSAKDLASAWIGPPELLEELAAAIPGKKRDLVRSYAASSAPSRESFVFQELHRQAIDLLAAHARGAAGQGRDAA